MRLLRLALMAGAWVLVSAHASSIVTVQGRVEPARAMPLAYPTPSFGDGADPFGLTPSTMALGTPEPVAPVAKRATTSAGPPASRPPFALPPVIIRAGVMTRAAGPPRRPAARTPATPKPDEDGETEADVVVEPAVKPGPPR